MYSPPSVFWRKITIGAWNNGQLTEWARLKLILLRIGQSKPSSISRDSLPWIESYTVCLLFKHPRRWEQVCLRFCPRKATPIFSIFQLSFEHRFISWSGPTVPIRNPSYGLRWCFRGVHFSPLAEEYLIEVLPVHTMLSIYTFQAAVVHLYQSRKVEIGFLLIPSGIEFTFESKQICDVQQSIVQQAGMWSLLWAYYRCNVLLCMKKSKQSTCRGFQISAKLQMRSRLRSVGQSCLLRSSEAYSSGRVRLHQKSVFLIRV